MAILYDAFQCSHLGMAIDLLPGEALLFQLCLNDQNQAWNPNIVP